MPRMQVYLPDDLYQEVKSRRLPASELLQKAVLAELRRQALDHQAGLYLNELVGEVGEPSAELVARAEKLVGAIKARDPSTAG